MPNKRKNFTNEPRTTRDLILDIAQEEIAEKGLEGLRLKDIADQVGIQLPYSFMPILQAARNCWKRWPIN